VRKIAENYKLPYYTLSPTYSICRNHGYLAGAQPVCPICGEKTEVNSRITGYYRPVQNWNDGKAQEFKDRVTYDVGSSHLTHRGPLHQSAPAEAPEAAETVEPLKAAPVLEPVPAEEPLSRTVSEIPAEYPDAVPLVLDAEPIFPEEKQENGFLLFATRTCPNCKVACAALDKGGVGYTKIYADEDTEATAAYGIRQAPTLVIREGDTFEKFVGVSAIKRRLSL
jgi:ribonucleoside-triphosphate reductase